MRPSKTGKKDPPRIPGIWPVALCLLLSGAGGLMLEVTWTRSLRLVFGSTTLAVSTVLVAYMLGLGLGGVVGGRLAARVRNGFKVYGWIEIGIGIYALGVPTILGLFPALNHWLLGSLSYWPAVLARFALALLVLLVPTFLMGATLPVLVQALERGRGNVARCTSLLYGTNTLGAVIGVATATFFLFPTLGLAKTNLTAAFLDLLVGGIALLALARNLPARQLPSQLPEADSTGTTSRTRTWLLISYSLVGCTALGYEVCWTRALTMSFGSSVYAFATILIIFLMGIALGSLIARLWIDRVQAMSRIYGFGVALLGLTALASSALLDTLPQLVVEVLMKQGVSADSLIYAGIKTSFLAMFVPTLVMGALFPIVVGTLSKTGQPSGRAVGDAYFLNTIGSATGAFLAGFVLIPFLGLSQSMAWLVALNLLTAAGILAFDSRSGRVWRWLPAAGLGLAAVLIVISPPTLDPGKMTLGGYYRPMTGHSFGISVEPVAGHPVDEIVFYEEGMNTTVSVHRTPSGLALRLNGKTDASFQDISTQILLGQIPMVYGPAGRRTMVIGMGSGMTAGSVVTHDPERIDILEIEPAVLRASRLFDDINGRPLDNPAAHVVLDDARNVLTAIEEPYDVIISEPSNPWIAGASNLFTRDFFKIAKSALQPSGTFCQWIQLYKLDNDGMRSLLAALRSEFRYIYGFRYQAGDNDLVVLARNEPLGRDGLPDWSTLPEKARRDLGRIGISSTADLLSLMILNPDDVDSLTENVSPNTDDNMYLELHTPRLFYDSSLDALDGPQVVRKGVLPILERDFSSDLTARVALSHLWLRDDLPYARELFTGAAATGESDALTIARAELLLRDTPEQWRDALAILESIPGNGEADYLLYYSRAKLRFDARQEFLAALADVDRAVSIRPQGWPAHRLRMNLLIGMQRWEEARAEADLLLASPWIDFDWKIWSDAAVLAAILNDPERGIEEMGRFFERSPFAAKEWNWMALTLDSMGRSDEAREAGDSRDRIIRNEKRYTHRLARWHELRGDVPQARRLLQQLIAADPNNQAAREDLARIDRM
ncbi:MAG: fused MFS/spermidine synthase [Acidobacteria bacterium]|uniref:Fused MFS/spermidine synthase n=1 Tax=Candidatus Polarisedimenticola svalbardensis TaxID=2886004 RepID=A0A8J6XZZ1_9BACT|nr:fused MFS/spermidine synthase [Candidatus Polarisedimenticola svalbardensis]